MATGKIKKHRRAYAELETETQTIAAGSTGWYVANVPISQYPNASFEGYYLSGTGNSFLNVYAAYYAVANNTVSLAARNSGTSSSSAKAYFYISYDA